MSRRTKQLALCGMLSALAAALMLLGTVIPIATYCCPMLASLVLIVARQECGSLAWGVWAVAAVLSALLAPDKEAAALFAFIGYYPVLKPILDRINVRFLRRTVKFALFLTAMIGMYAALLFVFQLGSLVAEFQTAALWMTAVLWIGGCCTFALYDMVLGRLEMLYCRRLQKNIRRIF